MKAMKHLLIVIALLSCNTMLMATEYQLHQTSKATYHSIGSGGSSSAGVDYTSVGNTKATRATYNHTSGNVCPTAIGTTVNFHSTSAMISSGSSLPSAATTGFISADDNLPDSSPRGPRRIGGGNSGGGDPGPNNPDDIYKDPLTDAVPCLLLLAIGYAIYLGRKTSVPNPDSRK
ncbi:MAG: hypothetical protein IKB81_00300 [Paludibacteraceae bacterium]|nr:hypothetical protein [Paludibacteraceae bacterium]